MGFSINKVFALQAHRPEFVPQALQKTASYGGVRLEPHH